jgi:4-amino-4-deoxy-L-arabinose transferase-like glycosyltransferase
MDSIERSSPAISRFGLCVLILAAITLIRLAGLRYSVVDLYVDESQYWAWSRELAFGYFSKPPLLAWIIAGVTQVCGDGEACVRAASPILYFGTSLIAYAIAAELYDERTALWTALTVALAPAVGFSARIVSTDVPLLFFWALALFTYVKLLRGGTWGWALTLGAALGLGLLAKYAMIYFVAGVALAAALDPEARALLRRRELWLALAIAAIVVAPNIVWNMTNELVTFKHTRGHVQATQLGFQPLKGLEFFAAQFGVIGPIVFGGLLVLIARFAKPELRQPDRWMILFAIPPLALIAGLALVHGAYANWAAAAFVSAAVAVTAVLVRQQKWRWLYANLAIGIVVQALLLAGDAAADRLSMAPLGLKDDPYRRTMGWRSLADGARKFVTETDARTIVGDGRDVVAALNYYLRDLKPRVLTWPSAGAPGNYFEQRYALAGTESEPLLVITPCPSARPLEQYYRTATFRRYFAFTLSGSRGAAGPRDGCR